MCYNFITLIFIQSSVVQTQRHKYKKEDTMKKKYIILLTAGILTLALLAVGLCILLHDNQPINTPVIEKNPFDEAFALKFRQQSLKLEPVTLPGVPEDIQWLSGSPGGRYLIGLHEETLQVYDTRQQKLLPLIFDMQEDTYGNLAWIQRRTTSYPTDFNIVWSPDERYFTLYSWIFSMQNAKCVCDLLLCDTQSMTISVKRAWDQDRKAESYGTVYSACFSPDSRILYFGFYGNAYNYFEGSKYMILAYDIAADTITPVAESSQKTEDLWWEAVKDDLVCLEDGSIIQTSRQIKPKPQHYSVRRLIPTKDGWESTWMPITDHAMEKGLSMIHARSGAPSTLLLTMHYMQDKEYQTDFYQLIMRFVKPNTDGTLALSNQIPGGRNACYSPGGRYALILADIAFEDGVRFHDIEYGLCAVDTATGEQRAVEFTNAPSVEDYISMHGHNIMAKKFPAGMMWCGDLVLLGMENGAQLFRFAD